MKCLCLLLIFWLSGPAVFAQTPQQVRRAGSELYMKSQVLHFDDFIKRFNGDTAESRIAALQQLFDEDDPRREGSNAGHALYTELIREFTDDIVNEKVQLPSRFQAGATVRLAARYQMQPDTLVLHLKKEYTRDNASYWHVTGVTRPSLLRGNPKTECNAAHPTDLPPNAHEVSFLPLLRGIIDNRSLCPFTRCRDCVNDDWRQTEYALQNGSLQVETVSTVVIQLDAGPHWRMEVREFIREKGNSGWLIADIVPL